MIGMNPEQTKPKEAKAPAAAKRAPWFVSLFHFRFFSDEMPKISPHAVIDPKAEIADNVEVGPFCVIGPGVKIDSGCRLLNNVTILGQHDHRQGQRLLPQLRDRRRPAGQEIQGRDDPTGDRQRQRFPRSRHHPRRHRKRRRA